MHLKEALKKIISKECSIQVFGLGYVGFPLSIRLAKSGFKVIGIDTDSKKIGKLQKNSLRGSQISLKSSFLESVKNRNFVPSLKPLKSELPRIGIICVPTPLPDQKNDSEVYVISAVEKFLKTSKPGDVIILESSVIGGTTDKIIKIVSSNGYTVGEDFGVCFCPERIDPLNQKWKLENIPRVIFTSDETTYQIAQKIYASFGIQCPPAPAPELNDMKPNGLVDVASITSFTLIFNLSQRIASSFTSEMFTSLDDELIKNYNCICVVQNHTITKHRIKQVYNKSLVPLIYDCQNKISFEPKSKTVLRGFGIISHDWEYSLTRKFSQKDLNRLGVLDKVSMLKRIS